MTNAILCDGEHGDNLVKAYATVTIVDSEDRYDNTTHDYCQEHANSILRNWMSGGMRENKTYSIKLVD